MAFDLQITFTGVCTFVRNRKKLRPKYYVILPHGDSGKDRGADRQPLRRHRAFVRFRVKDLACAKDQDIHESVTGVWYFKKRKEEGGGENARGHDLALKYDGGPEPLLKVGDLSHLANLQHFAEEKFCTIDRELIPTRPTLESAAPETPGRPRPDSKIAGRMLIDRGTLSSVGNPQDWRVLNTLNPSIPLDSQQLLPQLTNEVRLTLKGIDNLRLVMTPFGGGRQEVLKLWAKDRGVVELTIANLCDDNPLQWGRKTNKRERDADFRWHFETLAPEPLTDLETLLLGRDLPFPFPSLPNGRGMNCFPASARSPVDF